MGKKIDRLRKKKYRNQMIAAKREAEKLNRKLLRERR